MVNKDDQKRITCLLVTGIIAGIMALIADMLLGWGTYDPALSGIARKLSIYEGISDNRIFWSALLGLVGITVEEIGCFALYRRIAPNSKKVAILYGIGTLGYMIFAGSAVHVPCLATVYVNRYMFQSAPETALAQTIKFGDFFLLPGIIIFLAFFILQSTAHIYAVLKHRCIGR